MPRSGLSSSRKGIAFESEKAILVTYRQWTIPGQRIDLIVEGTVLVEVKAVPKLRPLHQVSGPVLSADNGATDWVAFEFQRAVVEGRPATCVVAGRAARSAAEVRRGSQKQATKVHAWFVFVTHASLLSPASGRRPTGQRSRQGVGILPFSLLRFFASSFLRVSRRPVHSVVVQRFLRLCPLRLHFSGIEAS